LAHYKTNTRIGGLILDISSNYMFVVGKSLTRTLERWATRRRWYPI